MAKCGILQISLLIFISVALAAPTYADVPNVVNYQGRLTDASGNPIASGPYQIKFKVYGSASGDDSLWSSGYQTVQVTEGLFEY